MKKISFLVAAIGVLLGSTSAVAQQPEAKSPYAFEDCKSGCYLVKDPGATGAAVYVGAAPRSFRVCSIDSYGGVLTVDGKAVQVGGTSFGVRSCANVNGLSIMLVKGEVAVGALP